jgi:hypothetical protein
VQRVLTRTATAAGALVLAGGLAVTAHPPAFASVRSQSFASQATGNIVTDGPVGEATTDSTPAVSLYNANISPVLSTGRAYDTAGQNEAHAQVNNVATTIVWTMPSGSSTQTHSVQVDAKQVSAWCRFRAGDRPSTGHTNIVGGTLTVDGQLLRRLPQLTLGTVIPIDVTNDGTSTQAGTLTLRSGLLGGPFNAPDAGAVFGFRLAITTGMATSQIVTVASANCAPPT